MHRESIGVGDAVDNAVIVLVPEVDIMTKSVGVVPEVDIMTKSVGVVAEVDTMTRQW